MLVISACSILRRAVSVSHRASVQGDHGRQSSDAFLVVKVTEASQAFTKDAPGQGRLCLVSRVLPQHRGFVVQ